MRLGRVSEVTRLSQRWIESRIYSPLTSVQPAPAAPYLTPEEFAGPRITAIPAAGPLRADTGLSLRDPENACTTSTFLPGRPEPERTERGKGGGE